jgi:hypothetical protein
MFSDIKNGSTCNFAGLLGDKLFKIAGGLLSHVAVQHDYNTIVTPGGGYVNVGSTMTVDLNLIIPSNGTIMVCCPNEGFTDLSIRDKFVSQCTIEELLVAVQAKLNGA